MDLPGKSKRAVANLVEIWTSPVPACEIQSLNHYRPQVHTAWHIAATYFFRSWRKEFHIVVNVSPTFQQVFFSIINLVNYIPKQKNTLMWICQSLLDNHSEPAPEKSERPISPFVPLNWVRAKVQGLTHFSGKLFSRWPTWKLVQFPGFSEMQDPSSTVYIPWRGESPKRLTTNCPSVVLPVQCDNNRLPDHSG